MIKLSFILCSSSLKQGGFLRCLFELEDSVLIAARTMFSTLDKVTVCYDSEIAILCSMTTH
jgi:hypothetical protein